MLKLLLQNTPGTYSPPLETAITVFRQAYRVEKSPAIHCLIENCFNLVDFIMNSRISANSTGFSVKQKPFTVKSLPLGRSTDLYSVQEVKEETNSKTQKETISVNKSNDETDLKNSSSESSSSVHGLKRKNEASVEPKYNFRKNVRPKAEVNLNDNDIIFEGAFGRKEITKSSLEGVGKSNEELSDVQTLSTVKISQQKALTTTIEKVNSSQESQSDSLENVSLVETTETSKEVDDALREDSLKILLVYNLFIFQ